MQEKTFAGLTKFKFPSLRTTNARDFYLQRFGEILPGFLTWSTFAGGVLAAIYFPIALAVFIIAFDVFWFIKAIITAIHLIDGYTKLKENLKVDWLSRAKKIKKWEEVYHVVIVPTYKEGLGILRPSLESLVKVNYPKEKMIVVLTYEERGGQELISERMKTLEKEFSGKFLTFFQTIHPDGIPGEAKVKGANLTWAAKKAKEILNAKRINYKNVTLSTFDCDSRVHSQYFAALTCTYLNNPNPTQSSYQPLPMFFNNIWQTTSISRVIITGSAFWNMIQAVRPEHIVTYTSHSMSFDAAVKINYWPCDMISDDSIIFWKCFICFDGEYTIKPIFLPVFMDAVEADTAWQTLVNQYKQYRRWAYGAENTAIILRGFIANNKIPLKEKMIRLGLEVYGRHSWATSSVIVAVFGWLPFIFGGSQFRESVLAFNLPVTLRMLMLLAMVGLFVSAFLSILIVPPHPSLKGKKGHIKLMLEWVLLPLVAIPMGTLPAIDAQTRLMLGKYMGFWVTPKVRKKNVVYTMGSLPVDRKKFNI